jgi:hypothetical protein
MKLLNFPKIPIVPVRGAECGLVHSIIRKHKILDIQEEIFTLNQFPSQRVLLHM